MHEAAFTIPVSAPFRLDLTVWVLRRRGKNTIDRWAGHIYSRILVVDDMPIKLTLTQGGTPTQPYITARLQSPHPLTAGQHMEVPAGVQKTLGLAADLQPFYSMVAREPAFEQLAKQFVGVRPPRFPTVFEALVNAIACQQVSLDVGILLLNRLAEQFGLNYPEGNGSEHAFPRPEDVFDVPEGMFKQLGFSYQKAHACHQKTGLRAGEWGATAGTT